MRYEPAGRHGRIADLPLSVGAVSFDRRERETTSGFTQATTVISLSGNGVTGRGEDVTYEATEHDPAKWDALDCDRQVAGEYTVDTYPGTAFKLNPRSSTTSPKPARSESSISKATTKGRTSRRRPTRTSTSECSRRFRTRSSKTRR